MHTHRGILHYEIWKDGLYKKPDVSNTLTCQYTWVWTTPTGTCSIVLLHGILSIHGLIYATSTYTSMKSEYMPTSWSPPSCRRCVKIPTIDLSVIWCKRLHWNWQFCAGHNFWLDLNHRFWLDLSHRFWLDLTKFLTHFDSWFMYLFFIKFT